MNDLDLEDIESHLYSQIYHSSEQVEENFTALSPANCQEQTRNNMRKPKRYFQSGKQNNRFFQKKHVGAKQPTLKSPVQEDCIHMQDLYTKDSGRPFRPLDIPFSKTFYEWTAKHKKGKATGNQMKAAAQHLRFDPQTANDNLTVHLENDIVIISDSDGESCVEVLQNWPILSVADSDEEVEDNETGKEFKNVESVMKSEPNVVPQTPVDGPDGPDDVIFVEPSNAPVEIINVDEDADAIQPNTSDEISTHADVETASVASSGNSFINTYTPAKSSSVRLHQERKELLGTPDSASNDFINHSGVELGKSNFNFGLHGGDFTKDGFVKPANPNEVCETESSSSTTDTNAVNSMKTVVFNEIEFPRESISFSEANLESFGNFIIPLREQAVKKITHSSTPVENMSPSRLQNIYSSDSSSESDFEDSATDRIKEFNKKSKSLPELSPMLSERVKTNLLQAVKKGKKTSSLTSKYDLLNTDSPETAKKQNKQKKRKSNQLSDATTANSEGISKKKNKNKKRKTEKLSVSSAADSCPVTEEHSATVDSNAVDSNAVEKLNVSVEDSRNETEDEVKRKKKSRESVEDTDENSDGSHSRKKQRLRKKKNLTTDAGLTQENAIDEYSVQYQKDVDEGIQEKVDQNVENVSSSSPVNDVPEVEPLNDLADSNCDVSIEKSVEHTEDLQIHISNNIQDSVLKTEQENPLEENNVEKVSESKENNEMKSVDNKDEDVKIKTQEEVHPLDDLIIVDEVNLVLSSDTESNLLILKDPADVQLQMNYIEPSSQNEDTVTGHPDSQSSADLMRCSVQEVQRGMSSDPKLWTILESDRMPLPPKGVTRRCNKCREKGHMAVRCPNKVIAKCRLCGESGHYEPRCPNRICTQCGTRSSYSTTTCRICFQYRTHQCELCLMVGHPATACPDLWRRYHLTTMEGPVKASNAPSLKPKNKLWCSGCARSGHLEYACRFFKSLYPPTDPTIKSYEDVYQDNRAQEPVAEVQPVNQPLFYEVDNSGGYYQTEQGPSEHRYPGYSNQSNCQINPEVRALVNVLGNLSQYVAANTVLATQAGQYHDTNNYQSNTGGQFCFGNNLPNFLSLDTSSSSVFNPKEFAKNYNNKKRRYFNYNPGVQQREVILAEEPDICSDLQLSTTKQSAIIFNSSPVESIKHFVHSELQKLLVMSQNKNNIVKNLKKYPLPKGAVESKVRRYFQTLNMILFGIYKLNDGSKHLVRLKSFNMHPQPTKLSHKRRKDLHISYCYIFGSVQHGGVDYDKLLRSI